MFSRRMFSRRVLRQRVLRQRVLSRLRWFCLIAVMVSFILVGAPSPTIAQDNSSPSSSNPGNPIPPIPPDTAIASDKILQFANAYRQVLQIIDRREIEIQSAETDYIAARILRDVEAEALGVIQAAGLNRAEYGQILNLANLDSEVGEEVALALQELDASPPPTKPLGPKND